VTALKHGPNIRRTPRPVRAKMGSTNGWYGLALFVTLEKQSGCYGALTLVKLYSTLIGLTNRRNRAPEDSPRNLTHEPLQRRYCEG
jgi:hypothetical protein